MLVRLTGWLRNSGRLDHSIATCSACLMVAGTDQQRRGRVVTFLQAPVISIADITRTLWHCRWQPIGGTFVPAPCMLSAMWVNISDTWQQWRHCQLTSKDYWERRVYFSSLCIFQCLGEGHKTFPTPNIHMCCFSQFHKSSSSFVMHNPLFEE